MIRRPRKRDSDRGQSVVEFVIIIPLVFMFFVGLIDVGRLVYINNEIAEGAREGARWGTVQGRSGTVAGRDQIKDVVRDYLTVTPSASVTVGCEELRPPTTSCDSGDLLAVHVSSAVTPITPLIENLVGPLTVTSTARMTIHQ